MLFARHQNGRTRVLIERPRDDDRQNVILDVTFNIGEAFKADCLQVRLSSPEYARGRRRCAVSRSKCESTLRFWKPQSFRLVCPITVRI